MATITTDTFLDDGTARTAGESWTINNGAKLTIRTDTRWHAGSPASMTGSLSSATMTANRSSFFVDGTKVRWMPFDTGSGTVPAIGTTITQGGVSGYLLGVWASLTSAPTAVGAAMPASGFLKFREVTGGPYSAGALTGISANATSADVVGWIEVVRDGNQQFQCSVASGEIRFSGEWFSLGTTTGSTQDVQFPTNGGGSGTTPCGVQIETSPGSGIFEWYPAVSVANFITTQVGTNTAAKIVCNATNGLIKIGTNGTTPTGYVPAAGCEIRVPNIFLRNCTTAARASNSIATGPGSSMSNFLGGGLSTSVIFDKVHCEWGLSMGAAANLNMTDTTSLLTLGSTTVSKPSVLEGCMFTVPNTSISVSSLSKIENLTVTNCKFLGVSNSSSFTNGKKLLLDNCEFIHITTNGFDGSSFISGFEDVEISDCSMIGGKFVFQNNSKVVGTNHDYTSSARGPTSATISGNSIFQSSYNGSVEFSNVTFGQNGTIVPAAPSTNLVDLGTTPGSVFVHSIGSRSSPINTGNSATYSPNQLCNGASGAFSNVTFKRIFIDRIRSTLVGGTNLQNAGLTFENVGVGESISVTASAPGISVRGLVGNITTSGNVFDLISADGFTSSTVGYVRFFGSYPTDATSAYSYLYSPTGNSYFNSSTIALNVVGDIWYVEHQKFIKGHTSFQNVAFTLSGGTLAHYTFEYQLDAGSGWNGTWKTLNAANISGETISPTGFKLKLRVTCVTANANLITSITIPTNTTLSDQTSNFYDLSSAALEFTGLVPGSEIRCYTGTDPATAVEIGGTESSGTSFSFSHSAGGTPGFIRIFAMGYQPVNYDPYTYSSSDTTLLVQQVVDRNYVNP